MQENDNLQPQVACAFSALHKACLLYTSAFPVIVENTETQEVKKDIIVLTKEHLRAAQLVGQSSKELITRICANEGYRVVEIGKPAKRDVTFNLPLLCGLADGFDIQRISKKS